MEVRRLSVAPPARSLDKVVIFAELVLCLVASCILYATCILNTHTMPQSCVTELCCYAYPLGACRDIPCPSIA